MKTFKIIIMVIGGLFLTGTIIVVPVMIYKHAAPPFPEGVWDGTHLALDRGLSDDLIVVCPAIYRVSKDNKVKVTLENPAAQAEGTWTYKKDVLTISIQGYGVLTYKLLEKTSDRFVWRVESAQLDEDAVLRVVELRHDALYKTTYGALAVPDLKTTLESARRMVAELPQTQKLFESKMVGQSMTWKRVEDAPRKEAQN